MGDYGSSAATVADGASSAAEGASAATTAAEAGSAASSAADAANYAGSSGGDILNYADSTTAYPEAGGWWDSIKSGIENYKEGKEGTFGEFANRFGEGDNYGFNMANAGYVGGKLENVSKLGGGGGSAPAPMNVTNNMMQPNNDRYAQLYRMYSGRP